MLAFAMSLHPRLGQQSQMRTLIPEMVENTGQYVLKAELPQLTIVEDEGDEHVAGICPQGYEPHDPNQIDMTLLLHITVLVEGQYSETLFSGHILPLIQGKFLHITTPLSQDGSYYSFRVGRKPNDEFSVSMSQIVGEKLFSGGWQEQRISSQNRYIRQDTPEGFCVEIRSVAHWRPEPAPVLQLPFPWPRVDASIDSGSGIFSKENECPLFTTINDQGFVFTLLVADQVVLKEPVADPIWLYRTIGCQIKSKAGDFLIKAWVEYNLNSNEHYLTLHAGLYTIIQGVKNRTDYGIQSLDLNTPEPEKQMRQDLLNGYLSFRVERVG